MVVMSDGEHLNFQHRLDEVLARHEAGDAQVRLVRGELRIGGDKRSLAQLDLYVGKLRAELSQSGKQALAGVDAVHRKANLRLAARGQRFGALLQLTETGQVRLSIGQQGATLFGELRLAPLQLK